MPVLDPSGNVATNGRFADDPTDEQMTSVIGTPSFRRFQQLLGAMPEVKDLEEREGEDIFDRMLSDAHVFAAVFQLKNRILSTDWSLIPPEEGRRAEEIVEHTETQLQRVSMQNVLEHLLRALTHKYAVAELVWGEPQDGSRPLTNIYLHERDYFGFGDDGELFFEVGQFEEAPRHKFISFRNMPTPKREHGQSLFRAAYWAWRFKQMGWESWSMALDKAGVPSLAALLEGNVDLTTERGQETMDTIREQLDAIANGGVGVFSGTESLEEVGGADRVGSSSASEFLRFCNAEISKSILTATLSLEEGRVDADRGDSRVHEEAAGEVAEYVARRLESAIEEDLIGSIVELEFGPEALDLAPSVRFDFEERAGFADVEAALKQGVPVSLQKLKREYNLPIPEEAIGEGAFVSPQAQPTRMADDGKKKVATNTLPSPSSHPKRSGSERRSRTD